MSLLKSSERIWKKASTSYAFTCEPSCVRFVQNKGCGQCVFPLRIMIPIQKQVIYRQSFGITWQRVLSQVIDHEATKVPYTFKNVLLAKFARNLEQLSYS